jgi:hypothetical protein
MMTDVHCPSILLRVVRFSNHAFAREIFLRDLRGLRGEICFSFLAARRRVGGKLRQRIVDPAIWPRGISRARA